MNEMLGAIPGRCSPLTLRDMMTVVNQVTEEYDAMLNGKEMSIFCG
jgi:hypothetical protein